MRIRRRLVLYAAFVAAAGMTLFVLLLSLLASRGIDEEQDRFLADLAATTAAAVEGADLEQPAPPLTPVDLATSTEPFVVVLAEDGTVLYATGTLDGAVPRVPASVVVETLEVGGSSATIHPREDVELRIHARRWERDGLRGVAVAGRSTRFAEEQVAGFTSFLVLSGVVTIIAVVIVSWLVVRRALRPLKDLAATAEEIRRTGDPGRRLPAVMTKDEVGVLTVSFNGMLERLQATQQRLGEALAAQRRFVADASHELRSPLTTVRNNAGFLIEHPDAGSTDRTEALADIAAESERMSRLVEGLLVLARADAGQPVEPVRVDMGLLASDVARKRGREDRAVRVSNDGVAVVAGDGDGLTRLVRILVDNALSHGRGDVDLTVAAGDGRAVVSVADRGPGIPDGDLERIFDRFYRGETTGDDGVGLGLAIARSIAEAHGGSIRASNRPEGGAVLTVELPALPAAEL